MITIDNQKSQSGEIVRALVVLTPEKADGDNIRVSKSGGSVLLEGSRNAFEDLCETLKANFGFDY